MAEHSSAIAWREWGEDAFTEARTQNKPVLLDIGAVWCHWCHVMDEGIAGDPVHTGTYSDPQIQQRIADHFIPIKVDNDRRPDINARYNMGGWPTTAFLTPEGETLYGETYVPPPRMAALLDYIADLWINHQSDVRSQIQEMQTTRAQAEAAPTTTSGLDPQTVAVVLQGVKKAFDPDFGGFGSQPKFPHPDVLRLALEDYLRTQDIEMWEIVVTTLRGMAGGGMYDQYAGGFFRYSTTRDWSIPHYEKMLEDNAKLTALYILAAQTLQMPEFLTVAKSAHGWLLSDMRDSKTGAFAGSQDADAEDAYYGQPLAVRATLPTPYIDRTIYTDWNALMVSSLAARYKATGENEILEAAAQTLKFLTEQMRSDDKTNGDTVLHHFSVGDQPQGYAGLLADQVDYLQASLEIYEVTGETVYLRTAEEAAAYLLDSLQDIEQGGFYDVRPDRNAIGELAHPKKDMSENADAALVLLRLSALTEEGRYRQAGQRALEQFTGEYRHMSYFAASYARAVEAYSRPPLHIVLVGEKNDSRLQDLQRMAWAIPIPGVAVETRDSTNTTPRDDLRGDYPAAEDGTPRAYVCLGTTCLAPVTAPGDLLRLLKETLTRRAATN